MLTPPAIGIVFSMFTALVISRWLVKALYGLGFQDKKFYGEKKERKSINFLGKRGLFFGISLAVIVAGFVGMGAHKAGNGQPLNFSMEFKGGTATTVAFDKDYTIEEIVEQIVAIITATIASLLISLLIVELMFVDVISFS